MQITVLKIGLDVRNKLELPCRLISILYIHSLSQKDEAKHKENHVDDLKTIKKIVTLSIYMYIYEFQKGALICEPLCQDSQKVCDKHLLFKGIQCSKLHLGKRENYGSCLRHKLSPLWTCSNF